MWRGRRNKWPIRENGIRKRYGNLGYGVVGNSPGCGILECWLGLHDLCLGGVFVLWISAAGVTSPCWGTVFGRVEGKLALAVY